MTKKLDLTKPVQTKSGMPVRIFCTDRVGDKPVIGVIMGPDGMEQLASWTLEGRLYLGTDGYDLVNVPEEVTLWLNVYKDEASGKFYTYRSHPTKEGAELSAFHDRVALVPLKVSI